MKVLACGEFTQLSSGYAVYMRELLQRLSRMPGVEVAELASYCAADDPRMNNVPWRVYAVAPARNDQKAVDAYNANPLNAFGAGVFNNVLLDFKPTHVIDIRDSWHIEYQFRSPLRPYYAHVPMPAIDAAPQHKTWLDMYSRADKLLSYTNWGADVLREAGLRNIYGAASPCAPIEFKPHTAEQKKELQDSLGLGDVTIVGTVMRNQRRKLFPELFRDFGEYLKRSGRKDVYLLCHTSNPDTWELDELMMKYGVSDRVIFTYACRKCGNVEFSFYRGIFSHCRKCNSQHSTFTSTQFGIDNTAMNIVYNIMDIYVQYAICEGYGMPLAEALACGVPIMAVDYSAMSEIVHQANGTKIKPIAFYTEAETGREMALPEPESFLYGLHELVSLTKEQRASKAEFSRMLYGMRSYDDVAKTWYDALSATQPRKSWESPDVNYNMDIKIQKDTSNSSFARWLITDVLQDPEYIGTFMEARLIRDISNGQAFRGFDGKYYHEDISGRGMVLVEFNRDIALNHFGILLEEKNMWEKQRSAKRISQ